MTSRAALMPDRRRSIPFALAVVIAAVVGPGCTARTPGSATAATTGSAPAPTHTPAPTYPPLVLPSPTIGCPPVEQAGAAPHLELRGTFGDRTLATDLVEVRDAAGRPVELTDPGKPFETGFGDIPGGQPITGWVIGGVMASAAPDGLAVTAMLAVGGQEAVPFAIDLDGTNVALAFPDVDAEARLTISVAFNDACYAYEAAGTATFRLGSRATVASCNFDPAEGLVPYLDELLDEPIHVGGVEVLTVFSGAEPRWSVGNVTTDYGTLFPGWDREAEPVAGPSGSAVVVRGKADDLELTGLPTQFYRRADALREHQIELEVVATRDPAARGDGSFLLRMPDKPGRFVTVTAVGWLAACASGVSIANFEVTVE